MKEITGLYREELVLKSDARNQNELFKEIGNYLLEKDIVTEGFTQAICEREDNHPTGMDLSLVADYLPNIAIPHTDAKYCKEKAIVFVKLKHAIPFRHMIKPEEVLNVCYLFFIINPQKEKQSTLLADLMDFITTADNFAYLQTLNTEQEIYKYLSNKEKVNV